MGQLIRWWISTKTNIGHQGDQITKSIRTARTNSDIFQTRMTDTVVKYQKKKLEGDALTRVIQTFG